MGTGLGGLKNVRVSPKNVRAERKDPRGKRTPREESARARHPARHGRRTRASETKRTNEGGKCVQKSPTTKRTETLKWSVQSSERAGDPPGAAAALPGCSVGPRDGSETRRRGWARRGATLTRRPRRPHRHPRQPRPRHPHRPRRPRWHPGTAGTPTPGRSCWTQPQ